LIEQVAGSLLGGVHGVVLERAFDYWKSVDPETGRRIEERVKSGSASEPAEGMGQG
jgi:catalase